MHAVFITLADHSFASAAHQGLQARNDSEQVLKIDPQYADAKMAIGLQQFAVAALPRFLRIMVGIIGVSGSKEQGLNLLRDAGAHGVVTAVESRTALSLFLRHDARYPEALAVQRGLAEQYPHDYLFRLEVANLMKDGGQGMIAVYEYEAVLADAAKKGYFVRSEQATDGLFWAGGYAAGAEHGERGYGELSARGPAAELQRLAEETGAVERGGNVRFAA